MALHRVEDASPLEMLKIRLHGVLGNPTTRSTLQSVLLTQRDKLHPDEKAGCPLLSFHFTADKIQNRWRGKTGSNELLRFFRVPKMGHPAKIKIGMLYIYTLFQS